jgi:predicted alpha/beta-fold hydrolase
VPLAPRSTRRFVALPDGDRLALEVSTPRRWRPDDATVVMIHGLCGSARSPYLVRLSRKLHRRGVRSVRMNLRGCGAGRGHARNPYHSGRSEDALEVLRELRREAPLSPLTLVGFSLGGNIALKLAGELGTAASGLLAQVVAVCPPVDLPACSRRLSAPQNRFYERLFVRLLRKDAVERHARFPDLPAPSLPPKLSLTEFDELYTAPQCGFRGAADYYARASAAPLLPRVAVPCRILYAADDPIIDSSGLECLPLPGNVVLARTDAGGHLGFLAMPGLRGGFHWMDTVLLRWITEPPARH